MPEEYFDVVDADDNVLTQLPRSVVHARKLLHRAVSIFVFNGRGELLLQMRSSTKDEYPDCWTSSASGHLSAGEDYDACAPRELVEETGLTAALERLAKFPAGPETAFEHTVLYRAVCDDEPHFDPGEVAYGEWFALDDLAGRVAREPDRFTPPFHTLFEWYLKTMRSGTL
jgi:16S rRNA (adenine1518-N6/adenine1519-N6)-dimethyltransferase